MSFLGIKYTFDYAENYGDFLKSLGLSDVDPHVAKKPTITLEKDGDTYTLTEEAGQEKKYVFKSGEELEAKYTANYSVKSTFTIEGNKMTQVVTDNITTSKYVWEFTDDAIVQTITSSTWTGTAKKFYKA